MMTPAEHLGRAVSGKLCSRLEPLTIDAGEALFRQGEAGDSVYIVVRGQLSVTSTQNGSPKPQTGIISSGEMAGEIRTLSEGYHTSTVRALCHSELLRLSRSVFESLEPDLIQELQWIARQRLRRCQLSVIFQGLFGFMGEGLLPKVEHLLEWRHIKRGDVLYRQGDRGDSMYVIVSGRLQTVAEGLDGSSHVLGEVGRGEVVGEIALFTGDRRTRTIRCIRDSDLVRISKESFEKLIDERPQLMMAITRQLVRSMRQRPPTRKRKKELSFALLAAHTDVDLSAFASRLVASLSDLSSTLHLNSLEVDRLLQMQGVAQSSEEDPSGLRLSVWLDEQEPRHRYVVYEADASMSNWTRRCVQRADHIIIVARASEDTGRDGGHALLSCFPYDVASVKKTLVLLHNGRESLPSGARHWLDCFQVHHLHHFAGETSHEFERLARILAGKAFGLVLSGGGANGFAHIGVIRAMQEAGVPIDLIGGTSMGAVIAAQHAMGMGWEDLVAANRKMWIDSRPTMDFTLPLISLLSGRRFDAISRTCFGEAMIEDLWLDFFCVSTNLTTAASVVHRRGPVWKAIRASCALPGITPPLVEGSELLVDGAVLNNLPVDVMREIRDCFVIAVDATDNDGFRVQEEIAPSPWDVLRGLVGQPVRQTHFPNLLEIIARTAIVSSIHKTQCAMLDADLYLRPPLQGFHLLDLEDLEKIVTIGYEHAKERIVRWRIDGCIK